ncbi:phage tail length tape measure family protein [Primorskyibacter sp. 2E107]|uniref:phage tail length tape measure family protein n=1 Tax=Primorskyibacter sp. 2E107 TaxID=3403458 RepID=UPI003AF41009
MANAIIGALRVVLGMDSAAFEDGVGSAQKRVAAFRRSMQQTGRQLTSVGTKMSAALTAPLVGLAYKSVAAQREQERAVAAVSTALESMGDGAGYTLSQLEAMASALQEKSLYGDEAILSRVTANLLTFGNISGDVFARAQQAALDLSARLGQDLQSSAVMLGKALNDPVAGLSALSRVGVSFTEQQKEMIKAMAKAGDVAGAQTLMLEELERQYKGQAEAMANTDSGKITQALNAIGDATEKIGAVILPILADLSVYVKRAAEAFQGLSPETQKFVVIAGGLGAALGPVVAAVGLMLTALAPLAGVIMAVVSPLGLLAAGIAAAGVAIYVNWGALQEEFPAITGAIEAALEGLKAAFDRILEAVRVIFDGMQEQFRLLGTGIEALLNGDFQTAFLSFHGIVQSFASMVLGVFQVLFGDLAAAVAEGVRDMVARLQTLVSDLGAAFQDGVAVVRQFGADLLAALGQVLADVVEAALNIGRAIIDGIKQGIAEKWQGVVDYIYSLARELPEWITRPLGINSPSRVFMEIGGYIVDGLVKGIEGGTGLVRGAMDKMSDAVNLDSIESHAKAAENAFKGIGSTASSVFGGIGKLIGEGIRGFKNFKEVLSGVAQSLAKVLAQQAQAGLVNMFGGSGTIGGALIGGLFSGLTGFATGGSFDVGGVGGIDSQIVAFRASPNESVHVTKPGQTIGERSPQRLQVMVESSEDLRVVAADAGRSASVQVVQANNRMIQQTQRRS